MAKLTIRVDFQNGASLGPGKIRLLEEIERTGSIRGAAESVDMSFRQAWLLLKAIEQMFEQPVIEAQRGGSRGGGSALTDFGRIVIGAYREVERAAAAAASKEIAVLEKRLSPQIQNTGHRTIARKSLNTKG